jgi:hypothetical protein
MTTHATGGLSWPDLREVALATDVMRKMPSGGETETATRVDVKEQLLKSIMGLVKRSAVE